MTVQTGDYVLGVLAADGTLAAIPTRPAANGDLCVPARTADGQLAAMRVLPMDAQDQVGFIGRAADGALVALRGPSSQTSCIAQQALGLGYKYMLYPSSTFVIDVDGLGITPQPGGRDAFIGKWADEIAGQSFGGLHYPDGIGLTHSIVNLNLLGWYPFLQNLPHHLEGGMLSPAASVYLSAAPTDGIWFHGEPVPLVMKGRWLEGPGPLHYSDDENPPLFAARDPTMDMPMEIGTQQQAFVNLKATLSLPQPATIRLTLRAYVVIMVGKMLDFYWAPAISISHPLGGPMDCLTGGLTGSGLGTSCETTTPEGGIASLQCHCICTSAELQQCVGLNMSFNSILRTNEYPACNSGHPRYLREVAVHGGRQVDLDAAWPHGSDPSDFTLARLRTAFDFSTSISEWIAGRVALFFGPGGSVGIDNSDDPGRIQSTISAGVHISAPDHELPPELAGTVPLPASSADMCFPLSGGNPVLPEVHVASTAGWLAQLERYFLYVLTEDDAYAAAINPYLEALIGKPYVSTLRHAYQWLCSLWQEWKNTLELRDVLRNPLAIRDATRLTNLPLRVDCFPGGEGFPPGFDPVTAEFVFGYDGPTDATGCSSLFDGAMRTLVDYAGWGAGWYTGYQHYKPPGDNPSCWRMVAQGGKTRWCNWNLPHGLCYVLPYSEWPICQQGPPSQNRLCESLNVGEAYVSGDGSYPAYWIWEVPTVEVRVRIEGCYLHVRARYFNHVVREQTCWVENEDNYLAHLPGEEPYVTGLGFIEVGRGAQVRLPFGWSGQPFDVNGVLTKNYWEQMLATGRLLGGCKAVDPGYVDVCGQGNSLRVYL